MYSKKESLDKFYTKPNVAVDCLGSLDMSRYSMVIEPSAGDGSFFNNINHKNKVGIDLLPEVNGVIKYDWFDYTIPTDEQSVLIVGNPPFGKRNNLSKQFIKHSAQFSNVDTIAFILPNVYNKHTLQKSFPNTFRLKEIKELERDSFLLKGEPYHVPCSFFIFDRSEGLCLRFRPELYKETDHWNYSNHNKPYDFFVMGAAINNVKLHPEKSNRGYYIKVKDGVDVENVKNNFRHGVWKGYSSANGGVAWMTQPELVKLYREQYLN